MSDTAGNMISIRQFKGYFVLIDFWASWSEYCRLENPNIVKAYHQFKKDGFTVVGVSLDEDKEEWLKAIKNDQLTWTQLSDLKGWENSVAKQLSITSIPSSILIDPDQVIIAKNLRGGELIEELSKHLGK